MDSVTVILAHPLDGGKSHVWHIVPREVTKEMQPWELDDKLDELNEASDYFYFEATHNIVSDHMKYLSV
jgi:hypothetical protein